jgi:hypothetical protein
MWIKQAREKILHVRISQCGERSGKTREARRRRVWRGMWVPLRTRWMITYAMRSTFFASAFLLLFLGACATAARVQKTADLGFGFRRVTMAQPSQSSFESSGHVEYLYFRDRQLGQVGACSISPSGRYAIYQDASSGALFLFSPTDDSPIQLAQRFVALVDTFEWHEEASIVRVRFINGRGSQTFTLR